MAGPRQRKDRLGPTGRETHSERSGGFVGDTSMEKMEAWTSSGAGVSEECRAVDADPNGDLHLKRTGREDRLV